MVAGPQFGAAMPPNFSVTDHRWALAGTPHHRADRPLSARRVVWCRTVAAAVRVSERRRELVTALSH